MSKKYDQYWGNFDSINKFLIHANVLDPRYKFEHIRWSLKKHYDKPKVETKVLKLKDGMTRLFNWYGKRSIDLGEAQNVSESFRNKEKNANGSMDFCEAMDLEFEQHMQDENNLVSKSELERYLLEACEDAKIFGDKFDVLAWWKVTVPGGRNRNRKSDLLVVRDNGTSFKIIPGSERVDATTVIARENWEKSRQDLERHLSKLRDFNVSNWF
ncbi:hypothetical protein RHMOL_Rhmol06G0123700 [Rhododendron molle]|uniref:Uncharacterized protein n=1 Tax=Rhododendron molle TaxID=49168 RepID=A0ACC0NBQ7_RHOML|nr:hypothetical protein RHMOL_Rhmol06G0123700 [Rhododendron molle]